METEMKVASRETTMRKWKTSVTREHLDELYAILKHGYGGGGTAHLVLNVPYIGEGQFAFTDTEDPRSELDLKRVKRFLSKKMQKYWDSLID